MTKLLWVSLNADEIFKVLSQAAFNNVDLGEPWDYTRITILECGLSGARLELRLSEAPNPAPAQTRKGNN